MMFTGALIAYGDASGMAIPFSLSAAEAAGGVTIDVSATANGQFGPIKGLSVDNTANPAVTFAIAMPDLGGLSYGVQGGSLQIIRVPGVAYRLQITPVDWAAGGVQFIVYNSSPPNTIAAYSSLAANITGGTISATIINPASIDVAITGSPTLDVSVTNAVLDANVTNASLTVAGTVDIGAGNDITISGQTLTEVITQSRPLDVTGFNSVPIVGWSANLQIVPATTGVQLVITHIRIWISGVTDTVSPMIIEAVAQDTSGLVVANVDYVQPAAHNVDYLSLASFGSNIPLTRGESAVLTPINISNVGGGTIYCELHYYNN